MLRVLTLLLAAAAGNAFAGACEIHFSKSGNAFSGTDFSSHVSLADLSPNDAMAQMRGIVIAEKMDVITEDRDSGTMLVEQRAKGMTRSIPSLVNVSTTAAGIKVQFTIKTEKGMLATQDAMRGYLCGLLAKVEDGEAGRIAAGKGAQMQNVDDVTVRDVFMFSREIADEAKGNALAVTARHRGRKYALRGRVDYIQEDGDDYNVSFDIPEKHTVLSLPGDASRVGVACLFRQNQLVNVLTFRKGESATFTGVFYRYDDAKRMAWLKDCKQTS